MRSLAFGLLALAPLGAQSFEVGVFVGRQSYNTFRRDAAPGMTLETDTGDKTVAALRLGFVLASRGPTDFQFTLGFQPEATASFTVVLAGTELGTGDFKQSHWAAGFAVNVKATATFGAGLEYRSEKLSDGSTDATYGRPWLRASVGYQFPAPAVKPFLALEFGLPLATTNNDVASPEAVLKSLAPRWQFGLVGGIRF
jgi:hypothetical protein